MAEVWLVEVESIWAMADTVSPTETLMESDAWAREEDI